ncbi:MAG: Terminase-like family protein [Armatimonadetes bacterium OLB18]|nr:MAG: Terminase-like family protein [Armatimonadetes bacterium OLB18]
MEEFLQAIQPLWCPHEGQRAFLVQPARLKVLACGRRWGKTEVCAIQIVFALTRKVPTKHIILAPTLDQAKLIFDRVVEFLHLMPTVPAGLLFQCDWDKAIKVTKSPHPKLRLGAHTVVARSGHLGRSLRGNEATHIVVDEAAYVPEELITEVAMPMLATTDGHLTMISTPHGLNHFWRFFQMGQRGEHGIWSRRAPSAESPHVRREFLEVQKALISSRAFRVEYEAEFLDSSGQVFRTESVEACIVPRLTSPPQPPYSIGIDWARYADYTAICVLAGTRQTCDLVEIVRIHGLPWKELVRHAARLVARYPSARVLCDSTGVGDPLLEMLRELSPGQAVKGRPFKRRVQVGAHRQPRLDDREPVAPNGA